MTPKYLDQGIKAISVTEICSCLGEHFDNERILAMFTAYMDESGDAKSQLVTLSCLVGWQTAWESIEAHWRQLLEKKNSELGVLTKM